MMNNSSNNLDNLGLVKANTIFIVAAIMLISILCIGSYLLWNKGDNTNSNLDNTDKNSQNETYQLKNNEILELYNIIKNNNYYPEYSTTSLEELDENILLSIVARSYGDSYLENITDDMHDKLQNGPYGSFELFRNYMGSKYLTVSSDEIISKTNQIFNKNITKDNLQESSIASDKTPLCTSFV